MPEIASEARQEWTAKDIREFLAERKGEPVSKEAAKSWIRRYAVKLDSRPGESGNLLHNVYDPDQVREAYESMPGRGGPGKSRPSRRKSAEGTPC